MPLSEPDMHREAPPALQGVAGRLQEHAWRAHPVAVPRLHPSKGLPEIPRTLAGRASAGAASPWLPSPGTRLSRAPRPMAPPPTSFLGGRLTSTRRPPTCPRMNSPRAARGRLANNPCRALQSPDRGQGSAGGLAHPLGWQAVSTSLGQLLAASRRAAAVAAPRSLVGETRRCRIGRGRGAFSRWLNPASLALTLGPLSHTRPLGGLPRAAPVPFRASCFTATWPPVDATAQRRIAGLSRPWRLPSVHPRASGRTLIEAPSSAYPSGRLALGTSRTD
jgi:hypothetical protein